MVNTTICGMFQVSDESSQHLFLECKSAQRVWSLCFRWIDILSVQHNDLRYHFVIFHLVEVDSKQNLVWRGIWAVIVGNI